MPQNGTRLVAGTKIWRKVCGRINQLAKINDPFDVRPFRGLGKITSRVHIAFCASSVSLHSVDQIICNRDVLQRGLQRFGNQRIAFDDFDAFGPRMPAQPVRVADQTADAVTSFQKPRCKPSAHVTGRAGKQNEFIIWHGLDYTVPDLFVTHIFSIGANGFLPILCLKRRPDGK